MKPTILKTLSMAAAIVLVLSSIISASANSVSVIDFEGFARGTIVGSVSSGSGISGAVVSGSVTVFGLNPVFGPGVNAAMIFDATCSPGGTPADCTGGDSDLFKPELGNVLIISEDLDSSDPNDADEKGSFFKFDFSGWGPGKVIVESIMVLDVEDNEGGARAELFAGGEGGALLAIIDLPTTGDNELAVVPVGVSGVDFMRVTLNGSGAIDNVRIQPDSDQVVTDTPTPTGTLTSSPTPTSTSGTPPAIITETASPTPTQTETPTPTSTGETPPPPPPPTTPSDPDPTATPPVLLPVTGESPLDPPGKDFRPLFLLLSGIGLGFIIGVGFRKLRAGKLWGISLLLIVVAFGLLAGTALTLPAVTGEPPSSVVQEIFPLQSSYSARQESAAAAPGMQIPSEDNSGRASQPALSSPSTIFRLPYFARDNPQEEVDDEGTIKRVVIPVVNLDANVRFVPFNGDTWDVTGLGGDVGWLGETPYSTLGDNLVLAGHVTVQHGAAGPFRYIHHLAAGSEVVIYSEEVKMIYLVSDQLVVKQTDVFVLEDQGNPRLALVTCTDWDDNTLSYLQRRVVFAELIRVEPIISRNLN